MDDEPIIRRRKKSNTGQIVVIGIGVGILIAAMGFVACAVTRPDGVVKGGAASGPEVIPHGGLFHTNAENWTHREVADHLKKRGLSLSLAESRSNSIVYLYQFTPTGAHGSAFASELGNMGLFEAGQTGDSWKFQAVALTKHQDSTSAKNYIGRQSDGVDMIAWGPWTIHGNPEIMKKIRSSLK